MRIGYAGTEGAFAHEACLAFARGYQPAAFPDFRAVISAVERGDVDRGMLPVRNSRAGPVPDVAQLLAGAGVAVVEEHALPVRMHLLGLPGARLEDLKLVVSHPMALRQCSASLARLSVATEPAPNTAVAAQSLRDPKVGALASEAAAKTYGLEVLKADMQDDPDNATTFVIITPHGKSAG